MSVFIDTGVLFAATMKRDAHHRRAAEVLAQVADQGPVTSDHVVVEVWMLLRHRAGWEAAMELWRGLRATPLHVEPVDVADLERAQAIAQDWVDQRFDIVDCTSFAVMERLGCVRAASFHRDFLIYRFGPRRRRALEILG